MKATLVTAILFSACIGFQASAQKKPAAKPAKQTEKKSEKPSKKTSSKSGFYAEPYATRNIGSFDKQTHLVSITYGFPNTLDYADYIVGGNSSSGYGPVNVRYEYPIRDEVSVGLSLGAAHKEWEYGNFKTDVTGISISPLGFYHFNKLIPVEKLDVFAGVGVNVTYRMYSYDDDLIDDDNVVDVYPAALVGARYYFTKSFSGMAEVGGASFSIIKIGVSFKI